MSKPDDPMDPNQNPEPIPEEMSDSERTALILQLRLPDLREALRRTEEDSIGPSAEFLRTLKITV